MAGEWIPAGALAEEAALPKSVVMAGLVLASASAKRARSFKIGS